MVLQEYWKWLPLANIHSTRHYKSLSSGKVHVWNLFRPQLTTTIICTCHLVYRQLQKSFKEECMQPSWSGSYCRWHIGFSCGDTEEECQCDHDANLQHLLQQAREQNLKLDKKKCVFHKSHIWHHLTKDGLRVQPCQGQTARRQWNTFRLLTVPLISCTTSSAIRLLTEQSAIFTWQIQQEFH